MIQRLEAEAATAREELRAEVEAAARCELARLEGAAATARRAEARMAERLREAGAAAAAAQDAVKAREQRCRALQ